MNPLLALCTVERHGQRLRASGMPTTADSSIAVVLMPVEVLRSFSANSLPKNLRKPPNRVRQLSCDGTNARGLPSPS